jgi:ribosomal 50S subunit-associated protein YjgA (DUF615 family)
MAQRSKKTKQDLPDDGVPKFKMKLDLRTTITVKGKEQVEAWLKKYPDADVQPL